MPERGRGRPREFDPDAALDAAVQVFWTHGYQAAGVAELCAAMGIAKQSMYDWVGGKHGLFLAALRRYQMTCLSQLEGVLRREGSPLGNLQAFLKMTAEYAKSEDCRGCLLTNTQSEIGGDDEGVKQVTDAGEAYLTGLFRDALEAARAQGELAADVDPEATAGALAVFRNGLMVAGRARQSPGLIDQTLTLIEVLLRRA